MAGILPTSIGQVEDQSRSAGNALLEILSRQAQNNPWNELRNIIDTNYSKAIKAQESELLANAIDTFQRRREAGQDVNQALEGLDSRITGSKAFQNRTDKIRESLLLQSQDDRAQREQDHRFQRQALEDQATYFAADFLNFTKKYGPGSEAVWMDQNQSALKKNPLAYDKVMGLVQGDQSLLNTAPGVDAAKVEEFLKADTGAFDQTLADANKIERELAKLGLTPENLQENLTQETFDKWVVEEAKNRGYTGEMFSSFRDNMQKAMNQLVDKANATPGGSTALVLPAMKKFLRESLWSWNPFGTAADVVHIDKAGKWMQENFSAFNETGQFCPGRGKRKGKKTVQAHGRDSSPDLFKLRRIIRSTELFLGHADCRVPHTRELLRNKPAHVPVSKYKCLSIRDQNIPQFGTFDSQGE